MPPRGDYRREQRSGKPVEKLPEDDKRMQVEVDRVAENDGQREHTPASQGESNAAEYSRGKVSALITRDDREKNSDPDRGQNVQGARKGMTYSRLSPPGLWSQLLKAMKNRAHPQPAGEDREHAGDEARNECLRKMQAIHETS
jgi:hypothetical protein